MAGNTELNITEIPLGDPGLKEFVKFSWKLYRNDPCWTPPLNGDYLGNRLLGLKGLLTPGHPYHRHAEVTHFLARRGGETVGRVAAAVNREYNDYHGTSFGFFGLFEVVDDYEVAAALLDHARGWVKTRRMKTLRGPGEYSNATHERQGVLIDGFEHPPTVELTHNPPYYGPMLERYGFVKAKDYVATLSEMKTADFKLVRRLAKSIRRSLKDVETRAIDVQNLRAEVRLILDIYNEAWAQNWGFLPISAEEGDALADTLRLIIDPGLVRFAFIEGKPAAVLGIIPDPNWALRPRWRWYGDSDLVRVARLLMMRRRIPRTRGMFFGIKPEYRQLGLPALLGDEIADYLEGRHYTSFDGSLMLEDNHEILKLVETFGGTYYKRWRIYDLPLE